MNISAQGVAEIKHWLEHIATGVSGPCASTNASKALKYIFDLEHECAFAVKVNKELTEAQTASDLARLMDIATAAFIGGFKVGEKAAKGELSPSCPVPKQPPEEKTG